MQHYSKLQHFLSENNQTTIVEVLPDTYQAKNILKNETDHGINTMSSNPLEDTDFNLLLIKTWQGVNTIKDKFFTHHDVILSSFLNNRGEKRQLTLCFGSKLILSKFQQEVERITWIESANQFDWGKIVYPKNEEDKDLFLILNSQVKDEDLLALIAKIEEILEKFVKIGLIPPFSWKIRMKEEGLQITKETKETEETKETNQKKECYFYLKFPDISVAFIAIIKVFLHNQQIMLNRKFMHLKCFWLKRRNKN